MRYYNPGPDYMRTQRYYLWALYEYEVIPGLRRLADGGKMELGITEFGEWEAICSGPIRRCGRRGRITARPEAVKSSSEKH